MSSDELPAGVESRVLDILEGDPEQRERMLAELYDEHPEHETAIRARLESMRAIWQRLDRALPPPVDASHPNEIGPYRIVGVLGEGGMGTVYLAEQSQPIRRRVALKVIKPGMDSKRVLARFELERQALGLMSHPGIARVFDAGADEHGRPFFSMEYVAGVPIHEYCWRENLELRARLELFLEVCSAAQHAHQKGVIHRDLKPSNILVTDEGGKPQPVIIDFGLARAMDETLTERTLQTQLGAVVGTPEYMSPEQADHSALDIDTRTDIYSLGVVLYELLAGSLPFDSEELRSGGPHELTRRLREQEPPKPSTRVSSTRDTRSGAPPRAGEVAALARQLRGDLDWITLKAMAVDRGRRYQSAGELAADIERFLRDEPVLAGPPSFGYRARKFLRRYRLQVGAAAAVVLALVIGLTVSMVLYFESETAKVEAETRAAEAREVTRFMMDLFRYASPAEAGGVDFPVRRLLHAGAERVRHQLKDQPIVRANLLANLGKVYGWLGWAEESLDLLTEAVDVRAQELGPDDPFVLEWRAERAASLGVTEGLLAKEAYLSALLAEVGALPEPVPELVGRIQARLGGVLRSLGRLEEAEALLREAVDRLRAHYARDHAELASAMSQLGQLEYDRDRYPVALSEFEAVEAMWERMFPGGHPGVLAALQGEARCLVALGRIEEALAVSETTAERAERMFGGDHPRLAIMLIEQAFALGRAGRHAEAVPLLERAWSIDEEFLPGDHWRLAHIANDLGVALTVLGRYADALLWLERAHDLFGKAYGGDHRNLAICLRNLAEVLWRLDQGERALQLAQEALAMIRRLESTEHEEGSYLVAVAQALVGLRRLGDAERTCAEALELLERPGDTIDREWWAGRAHGLRAFIFNLRGQATAAKREATAGRDLLSIGRPGDNNLAALALYQRAWACLTLGEKDRAEEAFAESIAMFERLHPNGHPDAAYPLNHYGDALLADGRPEEALPCLVAAAEIRRRTLDPDDLWRITTELNLGRAQLALGHYRDAEVALLEVHGRVRAAFGAADVRTRRVVEKIVELYERWSKPAEAERYRALLSK